MVFLRVLLVVLLLVMLRRIYRSYQAAKRKAEAGRRARSEQTRDDGTQRKDLDDLTQQDISDADFEEIP